MAPGLSPAVFHTLRAVVLQPGQLTAIRLAEADDVDPALARRRLRILLEAGLVTARDAAYVATPAGRHLVDDVVRRRAAELPPVPAHLSEAGLADLADSVRALVTGLRAVARGPR